MVGQSWLARLGTDGTAKIATIVDHCCDSTLGKLGSFDLVIELGIVQSCENEL